MQDHAKTPRRLVRFKSLKWILIVFAVFLVLFFVLMPMIISSEIGKNFIVSKVNESVDGKLDIGDFSVGWFKGIHITDINFSDNSGELSVSAKDISAKPKYLALLSGEISVTDAVIDSPKVVINILDDGKVRAKGVGGVRSSKKDTSKKKSGIDLKHLDLTIKNGDVTINHRGKDSMVRTVQFSNIASKVDIKPAGQKSTFDVAFTVGDKRSSSEIIVKGNLKKSKKGWTAKETSSELMVKIDDLDLATLRPLFALMGKEIEIEGKLNADIEAIIVEGRPEKISAAAVLAGFSKKIDGKEITLDKPVTLEVDISSDGKDFKIDQLRLNSSFCSISGKGGMNSFDYIAEADIAKTMDIVGQFVDLGGYTFSGKATEHGTILFDKGNVRFKDASMIERFVVSAPNGKVTPATSAKITFDLEYDAKKNLVKIAKLGIDSANGLGNVAILDTVFPLGGKKEGLEVTIKADLDIGKVMDFARVFDVVPEGLDVAGNIQSEISLSADKDGYRVVSDSTKITNLVISDAKTTDPFRDPKVELEFDVVFNFEEKTYNARKVIVNASKINAKLHMKQRHTGNKTVLDGEMTASYDLAEVSKTAGVSAFIPQGLKLEGTRKDTITFKSTYPKGQDDKMLANMNANATLGFDKAEYMGLRFGRTDVKLIVKDGIAEIAPFSTVVNEGTFNFAGRLDLQKKPMVFEIPGPMQVIDKVNIDERMAKELLQYLNPVFAKQANISGVAYLHCEKLAIPLGSDTDISDAEIRGTVAMSNMRMQPMGLLGQALSVMKGKRENRAELLPTKFVLSKGLLSYDDMQLNIDNHPMNFKGKILLAKKPSPLDMTVQLPYKIVFDGIRPKFETIDVGGDMTDRIGPIAIEGTVENHRINLNKLLDGLIKKGTEQLLKDQLMDILKKKGGGEGGSEVEEKIGEILEGLFK